MVKPLEPVARDFLNAVVDVREEFIVKVLGGGEPWTPDIKRKLTAIGQQPPASPDWRVLAAEFKETPKQSALTL